MRHLGMLNAARRSVLPRWASDALLGRALARCARSVLVPTTLALGLAVCSVAAAQTEESVTISVDATAAGAPLRQVWAYYGYDEANYTTTPEGEELLATLANIHATPVHVRTHFLFNTGDGTPAHKWGSTNVYTEDAAGNAIYDYSVLDAIMDSTINAGTFPLFQLGFMPQALSTQPEPYRNSSTHILDGGSFRPPRDYAKWSALVAAWATHVKERYATTLSRWEWELWNEPDIGYWRGTFEEFAELYDHTEAALHEVLPDASLGGPAVANPSNSFLAQFLEHCANGVNAVSGKTGTRLDMVSFHAKGGVTITNGHVQMDLGNHLRQHRVGFETVAASAFARTPIVISEADPDGCAACPASVALHHAYRNESAYGAYEVAMMKRSLDLATEVGVDLRGVLTWAFTFPGSAYFEGYRVLATNGIHLPVLNAFKLLGGLSGNRLPVASSGALPTSTLIERGVRERPDVDALATSDGDQIQILVWNYHDDLVEAPTTSITLDVALDSRFGASALVTHHRVDETHGNAFTVWQALGSPEEPTSAQLAELREAMAPGLLEPERSVDVEDGTLRLSFGLPRHGLSLLTIAPRRGDEAPRSGGGCSCHLSASERPPQQTLRLTLLVAGLLLFRRRQSIPDDWGRRRARVRAYCF